jgi:hypothetical protein
MRRASFSPSRRTCAPVREQAEAIALCVHLGLRLRVQSYLSAHHQYDHPASHSSCHQHHHFYRHHHYQHHHQHQQQHDHHHLTPGRLLPAPSEKRHTTPYLRQKDPREEEEFDSSEAVHRPCCDRRRLLLEAIGPKQCSFVSRQQHPVRRAQRGLRDQRFRFYQLHAVCVWTNLRLL